MRYSYTSGLPLQEDLFRITYENTLLFLLIEYWERQIIQTRSSNGIFPLVPINDLPNI